MASDAPTTRDEAWFRAIFDAHYVELRRFVSRRVEDRSAIEDVLAETFTVAWRRRHDVPDQPGPWLAGVCQHVIANHRRSARRRQRLSGRVFADPPSVGRDPADISAERSEITRAFARLEPEQREVLRLVAWDGMASAEAAAVLGCTTGAFRVRLSRARTALAKHLELGGHGEEGDPISNGPMQVNTES
jgi:RNA polymerase sigma-70 factor (ECF subfamily)